MRDRKAVIQPSISPLNLASVPDPEHWVLVFPETWADRSNTHATDPRFNGKLEPVYPASEGMTREET